MIRAIPSPTLHGTRLVLIALNLIGASSFLLELIFLRHFGEALQWVAVVAAGAGIVGGLSSLARSALARGVTLLSALGLLGAGALGALIHLTRNLSYADGALGKAFNGPAPVLAPLSLANVGLLLLVTLWLSATD